MKKTILICFIGFLILSACKTADKIPQRIEKTDVFLGDFDPIQLETIMAIRYSMKKIRPIEVRLFLVPRTNTIEAYLRDGMTAYVVVLDKDARKTLSEGIALYAEAYQSFLEDGSKALPQRKPTDNNAFNRGDLSVSWGVISATHHNDAKFNTNYSYLESKKPYFRFTVESTADKDESDIFSPYLHLYFSPSQLETLLNITNQDALDEIVAEKEKAAFTF